MYTVYGLVVMIPPCHGGDRSSILCSTAKQFSRHLAVQDTGLSRRAHEFKSRRENKTMTLVSQNPGYCTRKKKTGSR